MDVLADIVAPDLAILFCGTAVPCAVDRGHYHAGRGDAFWQLLHGAGVTPRLLSAEEDGTLPSYGCGLTDLVPTGAAVSGSPYDVDRLAETVRACRPRWLAFTSKTAGAAAARGLGVRLSGLGPADWQVGGADVFVLPSPSGANRRRDYDGRPTRVEWWRDLHAVALQADRRTA